MHLLLLLLLLLPPSHVSFLISVSSLYPTVQALCHPKMPNNIISPMKHPHIRENINAFKDTFQKPSQIYKFLAQKWKTNPLYLHRTLSYVREYRRKRKGNAKGQLARNGCNTHSYKMDKRLYFDWVCSDSKQTSQKTRSFAYECPWCEKDYSSKEILVLHLKCCHQRFNFTLLEEEDQTIIQMTLNTSFDGSYCGFKYPGHNLRRDFRFTPDNPERRTPTTTIIYFSAKKRCNISSVKSTVRKMRAVNGNDICPYEDEEADLDVCYSGRLYYHTSTCLPVKPNEVDLDSEADMDPNWLHERSRLMIDEFTDVNEGEKELLKMWNSHIMRNYKYKSDNMMRQACLDFVELQGSTILSKNISKNFALHLANLFDYGLISSGDILECLRMLNKLRLPTLSSSTKAASKVKSERNSNEHCQPSPAKRALLSSHYNQ